MTEPRTIVVFGSTGVQGKATIKYLAAANSPTLKWIVLALTRDAGSAASKSLATLPGVKVVQVPANNMEEPSKVFTSLGLNKGDVYGCFSVQGYVDDKAMVRQGNAVADAASAFGVKHLVYSSSDFGGLDDCGVPGFEVKRSVEKHILTLPPSMGHTFLRPAQFMNLYLPDPFVDSKLKIGRTVVLKHAFPAGSVRKHELISPEDIGKAAAKAFEEGPEWLDGIVRLAGDELTVEEIQKTFKEVFGKDIPHVNGLIALGVKTFVPIVRDMAVFFGQKGYNIEIAEVRKNIPGLESYRAYLERFKAEHSL